MTCFRCGGIFNNDFVANLLPNIAVKKFGESVNNLRSYGQKSACVFIVPGNGFPMSTNVVLV